MNKSRSLSASEKKYISINEGSTGLTWRSILALIYICVCFQPGFIYLQLVTVSPIEMEVVQWATVLLFLEISRLAGKPLTRQEMLVIFLGTVGASRFSWFLQSSLGELNKPAWIYQIYFRFSPAARMFGLTDKIPWFFSPVSEEVWRLRTLFHPSLLPLLMNTVAFGVAAYVSDVCLGLIMYRLYVVEEDLPFPRIIPVVEAIDVLAEREWQRLGTLSLITLASSLYAFGAYVFPLATETFLGKRYTVIPIPWSDFTSFLQVYVPGISLGVATSLSTFAYGFIIPFKVAIGVLIGAVTVYLIGNPLIIQNRISDFYTEYSPGMDLQTIWQRSFLHMWAMVLIGFSLAVGIAPLLLRAKILRGILSGIKRKGARELTLSILIYLAVTIGLSLYDFWLAPDTPIWIFIWLNNVWLFISALIRVRGLGYGVIFEIPYVRELTFKTSGYSGINGWFVPTLFGGVSWAQDFKLCDIMSLRKKDYILGVYIALPVGLLIAYIYIQSFWSLAPIPSNAYPGVLYTWPILSIFQALFVSPEGAKFFVINRLLISFIIGLLLYFAGTKTRMESLILGIVAGIASPIATSLSTFIGAALGLLLNKYVKYWRKNIGLIVAGIILGEGLMTGIGASVVIIYKGMFALPY